MNLFLILLCVFEIIIFPSTVLTEDTNDKMLCKGSHLEKLISKYPGVDYFWTTKKKDAASYFPVYPGVKCFSIDVKADGFFYFILANQNLDVTDMVVLSEIMWAPGESRIYDVQKDSNVVKAKTIRYLEPDEWRSFWFTWNKNVFNVGKDNETTPFMSYAFSKTAKINMVGIKTHCTYGSSFMIKSPQCPEMTIDRDLTGCSKINTLSKECQTLVTIQKEILNQMIFDYKIFENFKGNSTKTLKNLFYYNLNKYYAKATKINTDITETVDYKIKIAMNDDKLYLDFDIYQDIVNLYYKFLNELGDEPEDVKIINDAQKDGYNIDTRIGTDKSDKV